MQSCISEMQPCGKNMQLSDSEVQTRGSKMQSCGKKMQLSGSEVQARGSKMQPTSIVVILSFIL